jgi:hypothetical protein
MLSTSMLTNTAVGKPAGVQNNKTTTLNVSLMQPVNVHTLNVSIQSSNFKDNTGLSHDLDSSLVSLSGSFRLSPKMSFSSGVVNSTTKDKQDASSNKNNSLTGNLTYAMPRRAMAVQLWTTFSSNQNNSLITPNDTSSMNVNVETIWLRSQSSKFTFGVGANTRTDNLNSANNSSELTFLTRLNYSF